MGKSRLMADLADAARAAGLATTWVDNVSYGAREPYRFGRALAQAIADEHGTDSGSMTRRLLFTSDVPPEQARRWAGAVAAIARDAAFSGWEEEAPLVPADPAEVAEAIVDLASRYTAAARRGLRPADRLHRRSPLARPVERGHARRGRPRDRAARRSASSSGRVPVRRRPTPRWPASSGCACPASTRPRPGSSRPSSPAPSWGRPTGAASTSGRPATRCSSRRRSGRSSPRRAIRADGAVPHDGRLPG